MTSRDFCYWLQGYFEIEDPEEVNSKQLDMIQKHLSLVFKHEIDPSYGDKEHQKELDEIHGEIDELKNKPAVYVPPPVFRC